MNTLAINISLHDKSMGHITVAFKLDDKFWSAKRSAVSFHGSEIYLNTDTIDFIINNGTPLTSFEADVKFSDDKITPKTFFKPI